MTTTRRRQPRSQREAESAATGYESELWKMADALRGSMDAAEYKHVVLGLIFLKYISDAFEEAYARLEAERDQGADPRTPTSTAPRASSGCRPRPAGESSITGPTAHHRPPR